MSDDMICLEPRCDDPEPQKEMPSTYAMLKGFIKSGKDIIGGAIMGEGLLVEEEAFNARMSICATCPSFVHETTRCSECGCFMRAKAMFKKTYCPLHKWEVE
jgi:hypothetical protein